MIGKKKYPALGSFIGTSFHLAFDAFAETAAGVVEHALARHYAGNAAALDRLAAEVAALLSVRASDVELADWLDSVGCDFFLPAEAYTPRSFLTMIRERIARYAALARAHERDAPTTCRHCHSQE